MTKTEEILNSLGLKCSLGSWELNGKYYAICYNRRQGQNWVNKLQKAGWKSWLDYEVYTYIVVFQKK